MVSFDDEDLLFQWWEEKEEKSNDDDYYIATAIVADMEDKNKPKRSSLNPRRRIIPRNSGRVESHDAYFSQRPNVVGLLSCITLQKVVRAFRMLAYGVRVDTVDAIMRIAESTIIEAFKRFAKAMVEVYGDQYLRASNVDDTTRLLVINTVRELSEFQLMAGSTSSRRRSLVLLLVLASVYVMNSKLAAAAAGMPLAAERTRRKDPLDGLRYYSGGWNISSKHYMASVGFSAAPVFAAAAVWFVAFATVALVACCCRCCCGGGGSDYSYSRRVFVVSLVLLLAFTAAAVVGCGVLYNGQGKFDGSTAATLGYVVSQSDGAVASLRGFAGFLETAKAAGADDRVASLSPDLKRKVDEVAARVDAAADELAARTSSNSRKIRTALDTVRKVLIGVAAVMLVLASLGLVFSLVGIESIVRTLVFLGWILVTATFILSGVFLLLHNVVGDTCVAMEEWVVRPQDRTALDDILPCVDAAATSDALRRSKEVNYQLVAALNGVLSNVSNAVNIPPQAGPPLNYNQSGPPLPLLCNTYHADLTDRPCATAEVPAVDAQQVWQRFVCRASGSPEVCATEGRLTPVMYAQALTVANASAGLVRYGPVLADLAGCTFVRRTFRTVAERGCPGLRQHSGRVYQALLAVSATVMAAAVTWVVHSRERRRRREARRFQVSPYRFPIEEKSLLKSPTRPYR